MAKVSSDNLFGPSQYIVGNSIGDGVSYTSIQSAINDALATGLNQTVLIRPGTYIESFTMANFINVVGITTPSGGLDGLASSTVLIDGTITADATSGTSSIQNLRINTAVGPSILVTDAGATITIVGCTVLSTTFPLQMQNGIANVQESYLSGGVNAIEYDTNGGSAVHLNECFLDGVLSAVKIDTASVFTAKNSVLVGGGGNGIEATVSPPDCNLDNCLVQAIVGPAFDFSSGGDHVVSKCNIIGTASAYEFGAGGAVVKASFNKYFLGSGNYVTGTVGDFSCNEEIITPTSASGFDAGISVTTQATPPFRNMFYGVTTTVGAVSNTIITFPLGTTPGNYTLTIQATAYDTATPSAFSNIQQVGIRTDGATATFVTNGATLNGGDGPLAAAAVSLSAVGNTMVVDADGVAGATANWKCVISDILFVG